MCVRYILIDIMDKLTLGTVIHNTTNYNNSAILKRVYIWFSIHFYHYSTRYMACTHAKSLQSYLTPCGPMDCSPPGSSVHGILQATILQWVAMPSSRGSSWPRDQVPVSYVSALAGSIFTTSTTWEAFYKVYSATKWTWAPKKGLDLKDIITYSPWKMIKCTMQQIHKSFTVKNPCK